MLRGILIGLWFIGFSIVLLFKGDEK